LSGSDYEEFLPQLISAILPAATYEASHIFLYSQRRLLGMLRIKFEAAISATDPVYFSGIYEVINEAYSRAIRFHSILFRLMAPIQGVSQSFFQ